MPVINEANSKVKNPPSVVFHTYIFTPVEWFQIAAGTRELFRSKSIKKRLPPVR